MPSNPHYSAFASSLTPQQRQYIDLFVAEKVAEATSSILQSAQTISDNYNQLLDKISTLFAQVEAYESKFRDDSKYLLTRAKLISFMKEHNL